MSQYDLAHLVADAIGPLLALLAILNPAIRPPQGDRRTAMKHLGAAALGVLSIVFVMVLDFSLGLWFRVGLEYSGHTAFVTTLAISIWRSRPDWVWAMAAVVILNSLLLLTLGFHSLGDIVTSAIAAATVTLPWRVQRPAETPRPPRSYIRADQLQE